MLAVVRLLGCADCQRLLLLPGARPALHEMQPATSIPGMRSIGSAATTKQLQQQQHTPSASPGLDGQEATGAAREETADIAVIIKKMAAGGEAKLEGIRLTYPAGQLFLDQVQVDCKSHKRMGSDYDCRGLMQRQGKDMLVVDKQADLQALVQASKDRVVRLYVKPKAPAAMKKQSGQTVRAGRHTIPAAASGGEAAGKTARGRNFVQSSNRIPLNNLPFLTLSRGNVPGFLYDREF